MVYHCPPIITLMVLALSQEMNSIWFIPREIFHIFISFSIFILKSSIWRRLDYFKEKLIIFLLTDLAWHCQNNSVCVARLNQFSVLGSLHDLFCKGKPMFCIRSMNNMCCKGQPMFCIRSMNTMCCKGKPMLYIRSINNRIEKFHIQEQLHISIYLFYYRWQE